MSILARLGWNGLRENGAAAGYWPPFGKSRFVRDAATLAGGTALGQLMLAASSPLLTRLYTAQHFGQVQIYLSVYAFAFVIVAWRYEVAVLLPRENEAGAALVAVALAVVAAMSVVTGVLVAFVPWDHLVGEAFQSLLPFRWLWPVTLAGGGTYLVLSQWAIRRDAYREVTVTRVTQVAGQVGAQLALGGLRWGAWGLLIGDALGRVVGTVRLARSTWKRDSTLFRGLTLPDLRAAAVRYRHFPLISSFSALVNTAGFALPTLMLGGLYGTTTLGWYALVDRVMAVPSVLVGTAASQAYAAHAARLAATDLNESRRFFRRLVRTLAVTGVAPFGLLLLLGPVLFAFVFGGAWREAGVYARLLAIPQFVGFVVWPVMPTLNVLERQGWQLAWDVSRLVVTCGCVLAAARMGADARVCVAAYGAAMMVCYAAHALLSWVALRDAAVSPVTTAPTP